jgi:hypothetical protein
MSACARTRAHARPRLRIRTSHAVAQCAGYLPFMHGSVASASHNLNPASLYINGIIPAACTLCALPPLILQARKIIRNVGYSLIQNWRSAHPDQAATGADKAAPPAVAKVEATLEELQGEAPGLLVQAATHAGAPEAAADANGYVNGVGAVEAANGDDATSAARDQDGAAAAAAPPPDQPRPRGATDVEPGSFLGLLLRARDRASGAAKFSDASITAQASTFILAGYEVGWTATRGTLTT